MPKPTSSRVVLFLQGPASPILRHVADRLEEAGVQVRRIVFCLGDAIFWSPRKADWYRDPDADLEAFLADYFERHGVTDVVMLGDGRPRHQIAIPVAGRHGVRVHIFEHGYVRPDLIVIEPDGMSSRSRFPQDPDSIRRLARSVQWPDTAERFPHSFALYAVYDLLFHIPNVALGWLVHPHYRTHGPVHPLVEYSGWILKLLTERRRKRIALQEMTRILAATGPVFLVPLQLPGDYQILRHAPVGDLFQITKAVIRSFLRYAPADAILVLKVHPLDNGLSGWKRVTAAAAGAHAERIHLIDGGDLDRLLELCSGVVTVNSTVGTAAIAAGRPLIALGGAIYDVPGLTHQGSLRGFWRQPSPPDPGLATDFIRSLVGSLHVRGGFVGRKAIEAGARGMAERILKEEDPLYGLGGPRRRHFRYADELQRDDMGELG